MPLLVRPRRRVALGPPVTALLLAGSLAACTGSEAGEAGTSPAPAAARTLAPLESGQGQGGSGSSGGSGGASGLYAQIPDIVAQVQPSVVTILLEGGVGSGVVWRPDGLIITNEHVVRPALGPGGAGGGPVEVAFADGSRVPARVVAADRLTDIAVVDAEREDLPAARFQSALPRVGELAITLGSPLGFQNTAGAGIISGLGREIPGSALQGGAPLVNLIQTDAAISPGNSGGALVNAGGEIVGINEAYIPPQAGAVNLGFAIPSATAVDVAQQLVDTGRAEHAYLGVVPQPLTPAIADRLGLASEEGVLVSNVPTGSPASEAGIQPGDVITGIGDAPVRTVEELFAELRQERPGNVVQVQVVRDAQRQTIPVTVGDLPQ